MDILGDLDAALARIEAMLASGSRRLLGIVGAELGPRAVVVPMDGYHLANAELDRLGRRDRKGAHDTFDSAGYVALLRRLKAAAPGETVYAPEYTRQFEEGIAGAIGVACDTPLIITEGNYLLLDQGPWAAVKGLLDEAWYVDIDAALRQSRLVERHMRFGRSREDALAWVASTDEPNARLIATTAARADLVFRWPE
jgi:pantothenate kinase